MDHFILKAVIAGLSFALAAGPLGCFMVWRRLSFFSDTLSHASLGGLVLALYTNINPLYAILPLSVMIAIILVQTSSTQKSVSDFHLSIASSGFLALGLLGMNYVEGARVDLNSYLFGDILTVTLEDVWILGAGAFVVLGGLGWLWKPLLALTINEDLAAVEGIRVKRTQLLFIGLLAIFVAVSIRMIGVLLMTALFILPAAAARPLARSPIQMACIASGGGCLLVSLGLVTSFYGDTPVAPTVVIFGILIFAIITVIKRFR